MKLAFIIAVAFLGITTAQAQQAQTVLQPNGQTSSSGTTVGSDPLSVPTSSLSSGSSGSSASPSGTSTGGGSAGGGSAGSATTGASAGGASGATGSASTSSQSPVLLPGEIPDTSTQAASTTAAAPGPPAPICGPSVPSTDGGSANLTEIAGASLGGC
jgi:hypothetical protein